MQFFPWHGGGMIVTATVIDFVDSTLSATSVEQKTTPFIGVLYAIIKR